MKKIIKPVRLEIKPSKPAHRIASRLVFAGAKIILVGLLLSLSLAAPLLAQNPELDPPAAGTLTGNTTLLAAPVNITAPVTAGPVILASNYKAYLPIISKPFSGWRTQTSGVTNLLLGVACAPNDSQSCVAVGQAVALYTRNGGNTWTPVTAGIASLELNDVSCATATWCVAAGRGGSVSAGSITVSNNGGQSWSPLYQSHHMLAVDCALANQCVVVGADSEARFSFDGGQSWKNGRLGNTTLYGIDCLSDRRCWMVGDGGRVIGTYPNPQGPNGIGVIPKKDLFLPSLRPLKGVSCVNPDTCVGVAPEGIIVRTTNHWDDWTQPNSTTSVNLNDVSCPTASVCYAVGAGGTILVSRDGGITWAPEPASPTGQDLHDIYCLPGSDVCYAVGSNGTVLYHQ
jgi:photosystem II stability/assembly factor-like uncharacterized protein